MDRGIGSRVPTLGLHNFGRVVADGEAITDDVSPYFIPSEMAQEEDEVDGAIFLSRGCRGLVGNDNQEMYGGRFDSGYNSFVKSQDTYDSTNCWESNMRSTLLDAPQPSPTYVAESEAYTSDTCNDDEAYSSISSLPSAEVIFTPDIDGDTMLHIAIIHENDALALAFINAAEKPSDLSAVNALGQTPLHLATYMNLAVVVAALVRRQVALDTRNHDGNTALHLACREGHAEVASKLILAQPGLANVMNYEGLTCLHLAVKHEKIQVVELLVQSGACNINAGDGCSGRTVLHQAVQAGSQDWVHFLVKECRADVNVAARDGLTPLMIAVGQRRHNLVDFLQNHGAIYLDTSTDDDGFCSDDEMDMEGYELYKQVQCLTINGHGPAGVGSDEEDLYS